MLAGALPIRSIVSHPLSEIALLITSERLSDIATTRQQASTHGGLLAATKRARNARLAQVFDQHEIRTGDPDLRVLGPALVRRYIGLREVAQGCNGPHLTG